MAGIFDVLEKSAKKTQKSSKKAISQGKGQKISDAERRRRKKREEEERRRRQNQQRATQARTDTAKPKQEKPKSRPNATLYQQALQSQYNQKKPSDKTIKKAQTLYDKRQKEHQKSYDKSHGDLKSAAKTAQKISATGGYVQKHTAGKDGNKHQATSQMQKAMSRTMAAGETEKYFHSGKSVYENSVDKKGKHLYTKQQAKQVSDYWKGLSTDEKKKFIKKNFGKEWKELDKEINKEDEKLRKAGDARVTKKDATAEEYQRLQNALRASNGRAETMEGMIGRQGMSDWASRTAYDYAKGGVATGAQGFIEGMSFGDNTAPFNNYYTDAEKRAIEQGKESGAYTLGYMGGVGAQFMVGGVGTMGSTLAKTGFRGALQGGKGVAREAFQGGLKNMTKLDKKALAKQAGKEILADNIVSAPLDVLDAYKTAIDTDGKFDPATFAKTYGLNVAMNTGIGGIISGGGSALKGAKIKKAITLKNKLETGQQLDASELKLMNEINARQGKAETTGYDQYDEVMDSGKELRGMKRDADNRRAYVDVALENQDKWSAPTKKKPRRVGYHAGDLGKAESLGSQTGTRQTGHGGTGTYFFGNKDDAVKYAKQQGRPVKEVDYTDYNLYRPKDEKEGFAFHDTLGEVNNGFGMAVKRGKSAKDVGDIIKRYDNGDENAVKDLKKVLPEDTLQKYRTKADETLNDVKNSMDEKSALKDYKEIANLLGVKSNSEEFKRGFKKFFEARIEDSEKFIKNFDAEEQVLREIEADIKNIGEQYSRAGNWSSDMAKKLKQFFPEKSEKEIADALDNAKDELGVHIGKKSAYQQDSASTYLMKKLGYEGTDFSGFKGLDNEKYGSVIYDLKSSPTGHGTNTSEAIRENADAVTKLNGQSAETIEKRLMDGDLSPAEEKVLFGREVPRDELDSFKDTASKDIRKYVNERDGVEPQKPQQSKNWKKQKKDSKRKAREESKAEAETKRKAEREERYKQAKGEQASRDNAKVREAEKRVSASEHKSKVDTVKHYEDRIHRMTKQLSNAEYRAKKAKTAKARKYAKREIENLKKKIQRYEDSADVLRKEIDNDVVVAGKGTKAERAVSTKPLHEGKQMVGTTQEAKEAYTGLQKSSINDINERYLNDELTPMEQKTIFGKELEYPDRADMVDAFDEKNLETIRKWKDVDTKKKPAVVKAAKKPKKLKEEPKTETKAEKKSGETKKKSEDKKAEKKSEEKKTEKKSGEKKTEKKSEKKTESKGKKSEKKGSKKKTKQEKSEAKQEKVFKEYTTKEKKEAIEKAVDEKFGETGEMSADDFLRMVKAEEDFTNAVKDDRLLSETYKKLGAQLIGSVHDTGRIFDVLEGIKESGAGNKRIFKKMSDAVDDAKKDVDKDFDTVYSRVMGAELADDGVSLKKVDPYAYSAESAELLEVLTRRFNETGSLDDLQKIMELTKKNIATNSERGHALKACQALYRKTPTGRYHLALSELNRLNKKFADRLDKPLELTDDEIKAIFRAETEEEIDACFKAINLRVWDDIPSNWFERFNEWRHMTMLANPKTHARNFIGNGVFFLARSASDAMEVRLMKTVAKHVKDKDHTFVMATKVKRSEVKKLKEFTGSEWKQWYKSSNTRSRFIETQRPDGSTEIRLVPVKKLVNFNYKLLELEDLKFLQPEFNKELVRYCKAHNIPMDGTASKKAMDAARAYAGNKAQVATYRDVSTLSNILTGWKQKTASRTGKTALGTMGYRAANMVLESQLPFVKTPVNIFRRMMDYSPGGLLKSAAEMHRFVTKGDYDALAESVHYFCTGLTGSGVMLGGAWLAQQGLLMTNAGVMSGDEFYDRDMGFQDYSAMIPEVKLPNGTLLWDKRSLSLDWVAPMATSLFMGATAYEQLSEKGFEMDDITKALGAIANPMMEMSFMSSSKDLIETFLENAVDRATGETHWTDAAFNALAGSIPQGYMTSIFSAQLLSQGAQASDKYNRDTSSTLDGSVAKSWDRWRKQIINRIPVARQMWLEKKVDRRGRDSETIGDNVVTKFLHAFINPSATRKITFDDTDREIIKIYNEMPDNTNTEKKKKSFFFYNFTGNPSYDLGNGRRMTNKEKYEYTKENRHQHNIYIKQMIKDKAYNDMTPSMKAAEIDDAHWLATTVADRKVFGDDYAIKKVLGKSSSATDVAKSAVTGEASGPVADREAYDSVMYGAKSDKAKKQAKRDFLNFYIMKEKTVMQTHDSSYYTKAIAVSAYKAQQKALGLDNKNAEKMALAYNIYDSKMQTSDEYFKKGGSMDEYTSAMRRVMSGINIMGASTSQRNKAVSAGTYKKGLINERTRKAFGLSSDMSNMGYGLAQKFDHKYTLKELNAMNTELKMRYNKDKNSSLSKEEIVNYIDSLEKKQGRKISQEEKACLYRYFYTYQSKVNPYGKIPNFLGGEDTSDGTGGYGRRGWGRRGHRGWGHRGHRGGGGGGGEGAGSYAAWLKKNGYITGGTSGQSALTEAFRKRQLKNLQSTTGRVKGK